MNMFIIDKEVYIRLAFFLAIFVSMAVWEILAPRRALTRPKRTRWFGNLSLTIMNGGLVRLVFPITAVGMALLSVENGWGIFGLLKAPGWIAGVIGIVILDLTIYTQHVIFHRVPLFWRFHRMHHLDLDIDVTTGARFHPLEILLSMGIKMGMVVVLGVPAWSVIAFEVLLNGTSMFNHSNISMSPRVDRTLRLLVVTPDMHRVHHSVIIKETNSNFGFNLPWWDRLFGTYRDQPKAGHSGMTIGLANYRDPKWLTLRWMIFSPLSEKYR